MPVRWMAPESLVDGKYSHKSDVWAFGILLWEIFSLGTTPYPKLANVQVIEVVLSGHRLPAPKNCPNEIVALMQQCWKTDPTERPDFATLNSSLHELNVHRARGTLAASEMLAAMPTKISEDATSNPVPTPAPAPAPAPVDVEQKQIDQVHVISFIFGL